ncbi:MAG: TerB family tellurite resistance protein [Phycisphaerales bacterium]
MQAGLSKIIAMVRNVWSGVLQRLHAGKAPQLPAAATARLGKAWDQVSKLAASRDDSEVPAELSRPLDLNAFNCRARIGRQPEGESWKSVIVVDICGTIQAPADGHEVELRVTIKDATDSESKSLPILNRPKHGPLNPSSHFSYRCDMGRLCRQTTLLEDWTAVGQISPDWFVLPRTGQRRLQCSVSVASRQTGEPLVDSDCTVTYENTEAGYVDVEDNIQRAKTLAVGLAFTVGAANGRLLDPEVNVICAWAKTNFGSADASAGARLELDRALQKTATFFRHGGTLDVQQICGEIADIAPLVGRIEILDLCLRVAAAKGQVSTAELKILKDLSDWLQVERARLRAMVEKTLPVEMHQGHDAEMILGVTEGMSKDETRVQLNREYAKWSSRVISTDPSIRRQADQMLKLLGEARTQYVGVKTTR